MKVLIIEDETVAAQNMERNIQEYDPDIQILKVLKSVRKSVEWLQKEQATVDLIFMDIKLTDGLSFQIFDQVLIKKPIIFTTAYDEYAIRAFQVNSIDYLLKPITLDNIRKALEKLKNLQGVIMPQIDYQLLAQQIFLNEPPYKNRFLVKSGSNLKPISLSQIAYFMADGNLVILRTIDNKNYPVNYSLSDLSTNLNPRLFYRVTRNLIVHIEAIKKVSAFFKGRLLIVVAPALEEKIIVSNNRARDFKEWLGG